MWEFALFLPRLVVLTRVAESEAKSSDSNLSKFSDSDSLA